MASRSNRSSGGGAPIVPKAGLPKLGQPTAVSSSSAISTASLLGGSGRKSYGGSTPYIIPTSAINAANGGDSQLLKPIASNRSRPASPNLAPLSTTPTLPPPITLTPTIVTTTPTPSSSMNLSPIPTSNTPTTSSANFLSPLPAEKSSSKENIQVCVRIRPGTSFDDMSLYNWELSQNNTTLKDLSNESGPNQPFYFDHVYTPDKQTDYLYEQSIQPVVSKFCDGYNGTIFAYGQTASGKTHTILGTESSPGLTILAIRQIFSLMERDTNSVYLVRCSFMEIYNEELNDLLNPNIKTAKNLAMREVNGAFRVTGLTETITTTMQEVFDCIERGNTNRKVGVSNLNEHSSRSHSIFRITLESAQKTPDASSKKSNQRLNGAVKVSELNIVDLAGSETLSYDFGSAQQKETKAINLSLTQLKSVITALAQNDSFIPFRNSSLTKLLRNSLGGNAKTSLVCTLNPLPIHIKTTKNTLFFGSLAKSVTNKAKINEVIDDTGVLLKQQQQKIATLENKLANFSKLEEEKSRIQREYLELQRHLKELQSKEAEHAELSRQMSDANRLIVGGGAANFNIQLDPITVSSVSEEELAALSQQLNDLQSQKSALEKAKYELEAKLQQQLLTQQSTEAEIQRKMDELESVASKSESDRANLAAMAAQLKQREEDDKHLNQSLLEQQRLLEEKDRQSLALEKQLEDSHKEMLRKEKEQKAQLQLLADQQRKNEQQELALQRLKDEQSQREAELKRQVAEMEARALKTNADLQANIDKLNSERTELRNMNAAQQLRWNREMKLQSESGLDKDSYLAQLMDKYEREQEDLKLALSESESMRLVQQLAFEDEMEKFKRQLQAAQASIDKQAQAQQQLSHRERRASQGAEGLAALPVAAPVLSGSASASSSPIKSFPQPSLSVDSSLPALTIPGLIEAQESNLLLSEPVKLPRCPVCCSPDRLTCEKLRLLANHSRATLDLMWKKETELEKKVEELKGNVKLYKMQLKEYGLKR